MSPTYNQHRHNYFGGVVLNWTSYLTFLSAALVICVVPGPDMLFVIGQSVGRGTRAGLLAALGMGVGMLGHTTAVVLGVAALLRASPVAFDVLRFAGAAYLLLLAWQTWRAGVAGMAHLREAGPRMDTDARAVLRAALANLLNPKVLLFYLAFLPQFVSSSAGAAEPQLLTLGITFAGLGLVVDIVIALAAGRLGTALRRRSSSSDRKLQRVTALIFVGLATRVAVM